MRWPEGKRFAFSIFDDTDNATVQNVKPVYDFIKQLGFRTTKSVWVYPPRGRFKGSCLQDHDYLDWILKLQSNGFEIALHNVGDGFFSKREIIEGLDSFRDLVGQYPICHTNHVSNPDNIYWLKDRFEWPFSLVYGLFFRLRYGRSPISEGNDENSRCFWGNVAKRNINYIRNYTFTGINTLHFDPKMPYRVNRKGKYSNLWFSSSDGHTVIEMNDLLRPERVDQLEQEAGACIVYTHFASGFVDAKGKLNSTFMRQMEYLASKDAWLTPVTPLLDHLLSRGTDRDPGYLYRAGRDCVWLMERIQKRVRHGR